MQCFLKVKSINTTFPIICLLSELFIKNFSPLHQPKLPFVFASPLCWLEKRFAVSPPLSWAFSRFRFFFCTHKYKSLLKQILWRKAQEIWNLETMWNLQSYYLQFPWSAHSCLSPTSPGTSATGESHQHRSEISVTA